MPASEREPETKNRARTERGLGKSKEKVLDGPGKGTRQKTKGLSSPRRNPKLGSCSATEAANHSRESAFRFTHTNTDLNRPCFVGSFGAKTHKDP